ncbi:hypothetical protein ABG768_015249 [Culter alburnus]|uniref:exo-alpha-sialidase n=1 Tax=Culter alburnus TaxID=194366 RepID=A0AAW1Z1Q5_CULAL
MCDNTSSENNSSPHDKTATALFEEIQVTYRIPALIYISESQTYLAFAEKRKTKEDMDAKELVMRRGSWKHDKNEVEWDCEHKVLEKAQKPNHRSMNPCPVYERDSKTLFLFFICIPDGVSEKDQKKEKRNQAKLCYITSKDSGLTWNDITDLKDVISEKEKNWATFAVGPGHGVQMKNGKLIIPAYAYRTSFCHWACCCLPCCCLSCCGLSGCCLTSYAFAFYSVDKGNTWHVGEHVDGESNECQMAEIIDDKGNRKLYCNARGTSGYRVEALSKSDGKDFDKPSSAQELIETGGGCQGSVLSILSPDQRTWLLHSHPSDKEERKDLTIYINKSLKDPMQWETLKCINAGPSGYSDLAECEDKNYIACLFECGQKNGTEMIAFTLYKLSQ